MTKWEYFFLPIVFTEAPTGEKGFLGSQKTKRQLVALIGDKTYTPAAAIKVLGEDGWELVAAVLTGLEGIVSAPPSWSNLIGSHTLYFKRPITSEEKDA